MSGCGSSGIAYWKICQAAQNSWLGPKNQEQNYVLEVIFTVIIWRLQERRVRKKRRGVDREKVWE